MTLIVTTPPSVEPISLADAKAFLRVTTTDEDALIGSLVTAARTRIEAELGLALLTTGFRETFDAFPVGALSLSRGPLTGVSSLAAADSSGVFTNVASSEYLPALGSRPGTVAAVGVIWPTPGLRVDGVRVDYTAGFGPDPADTPAPLAQAILRLVAHAFDHRGDLGGEAAAPIALVEPWLAPYRRMRL